VVLAFFLAFLFLLAALAVSLLAAFAFSFLAALAVTLALRFLFARAGLRASAVLAVGSKANAVRASHLAVLHTSLVSLLHLAGFVCGGVFSCSIAVASNHCECESDSEESSHKSFFHCLINI
jgi:hypothetical protein